MGETTRTPGNCTACGRLLRQDSTGHVGVTDDAECSDPRPVVKVHAVAEPVAEGRCSNCGDPVVYNLAIGYMRHQDADPSITCATPWPASLPATSPTGDPTDAR